MMLEAENKSWKTAIARTHPSRPAIWIDTQYQHFGGGSLQSFHGQGGFRMLDYGCGRGYDAKYFECEGYDPYWAPTKPTGKYDIILCTYVLNVVDRTEQWKILGRIENLCKFNGTVYVSVRRDINPFKDTSRNGYVQRYVTTGDMKLAGYRSVYHSKNDFEIFAIGSVPSLENR